MTNDISKTNYDDVINEPAGRRNGDNVFGETKC